MNATIIQTGGEKMEIIFNSVVDVQKRSIADMVDALGISWVNPRVGDTDYPFLSSFSGAWNVEVLRPKNKVKFEDIVRETKKDGWQPATVYHLLEVLTTQNGKSMSGSFMAPGSLCTDDFEYPGCVVLTFNMNEKKLGLGNWRGSKIGGYDIVRIRRA